MGGGLLLVTLVLSKKKKSNKSIRKKPYNTITLSRMKPKKCLISFETLLPHPHPHFTTPLIYLTKQNIAHPSPLWGKWRRTMQQLPDDGFTACSRGGSIIVHGGSRGSSILGNTWSVDAQSGLVSYITTVHTPQPRTHHAAVLRHDTLVILSGKTLRPTDPRLVPTLDLTTQHWDTLSTTGHAPPASILHSAEALGDSIYVCGGIVLDTDEPGRVYSLDTKTLLWKEVLCTPSPQLWGHSCVEAADGRQLFAVGGVGDNATWVYRPAKGWYRYATKRYKANYSFIAGEPGQLGFARKEVLREADTTTTDIPGWLRLQNASNDVGLCPANRLSEVRSYPGGAHCSACMLSGADDVHYLLATARRQQNPEVWMLQVDSEVWTHIAPPDDIAPNPTHLSGGFPKLLCVDGCGVLLNLSNSTMHRFDLASTSWHTIALHTEPPRTSSSSANQQECVSTHSHGTSRTSRTSRTSHSHSPPPGEAARHAMREYPVRLPPPFNAFDTPSHIPQGWTAPENPRGMLRVVQTPESSEAYDVRRAQGSSVGSAGGRETAARSMGGWTAPVHSEDTSSFGNTNSTETVVVSAEMPAVGVPEPQMLTPQVCDEGGVAAGCVDTPIKYTSIFSASTITSSEWRGK